MSPVLLLRLEGILVLVAAVFGYSLLSASWWLFLALLLVPDVFMLGYLAGPRLGALLYNAGHTYAVPILLGAVAVGLGSAFVGALALIWTAHIGMDRALGYGLKHPSGFHDTHLSHSGSEATFPGGRRRVVEQSPAKTTLFLGFALMLAGCSSAPPFEEGRWRGALTPMNHPEMATPVAYDVRHDDGGLAISLLGPNDTRVPIRDPRLDGDTLRFAFVEPEEQVLLRCALGRDEAGGFGGRCADPSGKWARFTMIPPAQP